MLTFSSQELGLYRQCLNEVLRCFTLPGMEQTVGVSNAILMKEDSTFAALSRTAEISSADLPFPVRPLVIEEAIRQLGVSEFQTRTGSPLSQGYLLLDKVKKTP